MNGDGREETSGTANGTITGAIAANDRFNNPSQALSFDGVDDIMQASDSLLPKGAANRTVCCFYKVRSFPAANVNELALISYGISQTNKGFFLTHDLTSRKLTWSQWGSALTWNQDPLEPNVWRFAGVTISGTTVTLFSDGVKRNQASFGVDTGTNGKINIGRAEGALGNTRRFNGEIDDVRIYNRSISEEEMLLLNYLMTHDSDGDGSNDFDEMAVFGTNHESVDSDGDGYRDGVEVLYKSNPADPASKPNYVENFAAVELEFPTALGKNYQLQGSDDLVTWTNIGAPFAGTGGVITELFSTRGGRKRFWHWIEVP